jgi:beta-D-xylosidase 4
MMGVFKELTATWAVFALFRSGHARFTYPDCANGPMSSNLVCDQDADPARRAAALVASMSISDKLQNLVEYVYNPLA